MSGAMAAPLPLEREVLFDLVEGDIAVVKLNRPERRNAVNGDVMRALSWLVARTETDSAIAGVVLTSSTDGFFCAGADLSAIAIADGRKDGFRRRTEALRGSSMPRAGAVTIAAIDRYVLMS